MNDAPRADLSEGAFAAAEVQSSQEKGDMRLSRPKGWGEATGRPQARGQGCMFPLAVPRTFRAFRTSLKASWGGLCPSPHPPPCLLGPPRYITSSPQAPLVK